MIPIKLMVKVMIQMLKIPEKSNFHHILDFFQIWSAVSQNAWSENQKNGQTHVLKDQNTQKSEKKPKNIFFFNFQPFFAFFQLWRAVSQKSMVQKSKKWSNSCSPCSKYPIKSKKTIKIHFWIFTQKWPILIGRKNDQKVMASDRVEWGIIR